jgi:hypothetical protein
MSPADSTHTHAGACNEVCVDDFGDEEPKGVLWGPSDTPVEPHAHDWQIGAREYEDGDVRALQVYCTGCDEAGRFVREAAHPTASADALRAALSEYLAVIEADNSPAVMYQYEQKLRAAFDAALASSPPPTEGLDVERLLAACARVGLNLTELQGRAIVRQYVRLSSPEGQK